MAGKSRADIRVLLITREGPACQAYQEALSVLQVPFSVAHDFVVTQRVLQDVPHNGLLVDLATAIRGSQACKALAHEMLNLYPVVRLKWDPHRQKINTLFYGQDQHHSEGLEAFIDQQCLCFPARRIRRTERKALHANLRLSRSADFEPDSTERTNTLDISEGGCFIYSVDDWQPGETVWIRCCEMADDTPIEATVAWSVPWGLPGRLPGIGVKFEGMTAAQRKRLTTCLVMGFTLTEEDQADSDTGSAA